MKAIYNGKPYQVNTLFLQDGDGEIEVAASEVKVIVEEGVILEKNPDVENIDPDGLPTPNVEKIRDVARDLLSEPGEPPTIHVGINPRKINAPTVPGKWKNWKSTDLNPEGEN